MEFSIKELERRQTLKKFKEQTKQRTMCIAGHRLANLNLKDLNSSDFNKLRTDIVNTVKENKIETVVCKSSLGINSFCIDFLSNVRDDLGIKLEVAIPYKFQRDLDTDAFDSMWKKADKVTYVDTISDYSCLAFRENMPHPSKMQMVHRYMVDNSYLVYLIWDGTQTGETHNAYYLALRAGHKKIRVFNPKQKEDEVACYKL